MSGQLADNMPGSESFDQQGNRGRWDSTGLAFLGFLTTVLRDWGTTLRLAFLVGVTAGAVGPLFRFVRIEDQWHWVLLGAVGVGGVAKLRQWRESRNGDSE